MFHALVSRTGNVLVYTHFLSGILELAAHSRVDADVVIRSFSYECRLPSASQSFSHECISQSVLRRTSLDGLRPIVFSPANKLFIYL
jgi:hypothetical protein